MPERVARRIRIEGTVQGVGFRPFVHSLAARFALTGSVRNDTLGVLVEVEGSPESIERFVAVIRQQPPPLAVVERVTVERVDPRGDGAFSIIESETAGTPQTLVSPDIATCEDCLIELFDPSDRRYRYPFINCTNCGPRFTIVRDVPYDRSATTMSVFPMCGACSREYRDPSNRRFHAEPVCCPACGPTLRLIEFGGQAPEEDPLVRTARLLREGKIVAVKGLGGYHLAADASNEQAVAALRSRKHREDKAFALMVTDVEAARRICDVDPSGETGLSDARRPIVLLPRRGDAAIARSVAPGNRFLGVMLPYSAMHHLLARELDRPFVLTSGNVSDEPIAYRDEDAIERLSGIADAFLSHNREIHIRTDDSVVRPFNGSLMAVRRSRGYVPQPLRLRKESPRQVLGCGAELKNTFCLVKKQRAFVSHHIGDLENYETLRSYVEGIEHFSRLFDVTPEVVAHDLHPEYLSTKYALEKEGVDLVAVQHHHAHVASCLADNGEEGPVIGVAFDGLGYGPDGTMWGGEFLVADLTGFERAGHFMTVPMPGGAAAIKEPWRMAAAYLDAAYAGHVPEVLDVVRRNEERWSDVIAVSSVGVNSPQTSSCGRLFDAVASILGVRDAINYEGQAAVELEQRAEPSEAGAYTPALEGDFPFVVRPLNLVRSVVEDLVSGRDIPVIAARFHNGIAGVIASGAERIRASRGLSTVALTGGVFQNALLLERAVMLLAERGFRVLLHSRVPSNDGGISLGQAVVAGWAR